MEIFSNPILLTDSYKLSHYDQYPPEMTAMQSYLESRGGEYNDIVFYGLEYIIGNYLNREISDEDIADASFYAMAHGVPFNDKGFREIQAMGSWPVRVVAKREGAICRVGEPLLTIESTSRNHPWVVNYLETLLMKIWYPCTVASKAYHVRKLIEKHYEATGANREGIPFTYHNFGDRGSSSVEAASIGGAAHLISFKGTDNFASLDFIAKTYVDSDTDIGFSIPATEHSTVTSWGKEREFTMIENYLERNKGKSIIACVMDSYNIYKAVEYVTTHLKSRIESSQYPTFVIRPDSGNPLDVIPTIFSILEANKCQYTTHSAEGRDYKLFNKYRIIWGDGVDPQAIDDILTLVVALGYSPANMAFGSGGDLMQKVNRDTCKFAMKCCAVKYDTNPEWLPIYKEPLHDGFKKSKGGYQNVHNGIVYYDNGYAYHGHTFNDVRMELNRIR